MPHCGPRRPIQLTLVPVKLKVARARHRGRSGDGGGSAAPGFRRVALRPAAREAGAESVRTRSKKGQPEPNHPEVPGGSSALRACQRTTADRISGHAESSAARALETLFSRRRQTLSRVRATRTSTFTKNRRPPPGTDVAA